MVFGPYTRNPKPPSRFKASEASISDSEYDEAQLGITRLRFPWTPPSPQKFRTPVMPGSAETSEKGSATGGEDPARLWGCTRFVEPWVGTVYKSEIK